MLSTPDEYCNQHICLLKKIARLEAQNVLQTALILIILGGSIHGSI